MGKEARSGTLMWIGSRNAAELRPIYQFCEQNVSQIAVRRDLQDARSRRADNVRCIILARTDRTGIHYSQVQRLVAQHPYAKTVELLGALCTQREPTQPTIRKVYWHRWNEVLHYLADCGMSELDSPQQARSVAVMADSLSTADPLMDLAASTDAAAVWCRQPGSLSARNFDVVWWDDSVATAASEAEWRQRLSMTKQHSSVVQTHVWMTNYPNPGNVAAAECAGVAAVLSKPARIENLLATLGADSQRQSQHQRLRAA